VKPLRLIILGLWGSYLYFQTMNQSMRPWGQGKGVAGLNLEIICEVVSSKS
jgi:hypothetical protein